MDNGKRLLSGHRPPWNARFKENLSLGCVGDRFAGERKWYIMRFESHNWRREPAASGRGSALDR